MRLTILVLFFCVGRMAICQSAPTTAGSPPAASRDWNSPQREWKINPRQPLPGIVGRQFGKTLLAQNEPLNSQLPLRPFPNAKLEPIPTQWPNAVTEAIPTQWPNFKLLPIKANPPVILAAPAYGGSK